MNNKFFDFLEKKELGEDLSRVINEDVSTNRYSIEVNYRTKADEVKDGFAKLCLGYVSSALKNADFHVKIVLNTKPLRIMVSSRNWDDGEWVAFVVFDSNTNCFVIGSGYYIKERKSVSIQEKRKSQSYSAAELVIELKRELEKLKDKQPLDANVLNPVKLKRGSFKKPF